MNQDTASPRYCAVIPAAGIGARMGAAGPKQYLALRGRTVLAHSLTRIGGHPRIAATVLVLAAEDDQWSRTDAADAAFDVIVTQGGAERCHSVLNGLRALAGRAAPHDWVLVHDAARPCVRREDIDRLMDQLRDHPAGGLLGIPVTDTIKSADEYGDIVRTVHREGLWRALTPQMFRYEMLLRALETIIASGGTVTDESAAMEAAGFVPRMVEGHADNIKITRPGDLDLAEFYLRQQETT